MFPIVKRYFFFFLRFILFFPFYNLRFVIDVSRRLNWIKGLAKYFDLRSAR